MVLTLAFHLLQPAAGAIPFRPLQRPSGLRQPIWQPSRSPASPELEAKPGQNLPGRQGPASLGGQSAVSDRLALLKAKLGEERRRAAQGKHALAWQIRPMSVFAHRPSRAALSSVPEPP